MMKRIPKILAPEIKNIEHVEKEGYIKEVRYYKLITPLYGGGEEPAKPDSVTVIRGSEVRGHLRFWWRATRGGQEKFEGKLEKMREEEERIWGSAVGDKKPGPSGVRVRIFDGVKGKELRTQKKGDKTLHISDPRTDYGYIAFPLKEEKEKNKPAGSVWENGSFTLEISYPQKWEVEVEAALWAWETFGGIGGRTRRGFGALQLTERIKNNRKEEMPLFDAKSIETDLKIKLGDYVSSGAYSKDVPHLSQTMQFKIVQPSSNAWLYLIEKYQSFRQKRHKKFGKSLWPEANELRRRFGKPMNWIAEDMKDNKPPILVKKFPRAVFGLPILYHLPKDGDKTFTLQGKPEPKTGKKFERLSSVLILKPIPCKDGKTVGLAALLQGPTIPPYGLEIKEPMKNKDEVEWKITPDDIENNPLKDVLGSQNDVLQSFFNYLK